MVSGIGSIVMRRVNRGIGRRGRGGHASASRRRAANPRARVIRALSWSSGLLPARSGLRRARVFPMKGLDDQVFANLAIPGILDRWRPGDDPVEQGLCRRLLRP